MKKILLTLVIMILLATPAWGQDDYGISGQWNDRFWGNYEVTWTIGGNSLTEDFTIAMHPPLNPRFMNQLYTPESGDRQTWTIEDNIYNETWTHTAYVHENSMYATGVSQSKIDTFGLQTYSYGLVFYGDYSGGTIDFSCVWHEDWHDANSTPYLYMEGTFVRVE